ncbi:MAG: hypothetical protein IJU64_05475 [Bacilli bacterium]|nr:hypothetical protein [Bacilli bacterium]
MDCPVCGKFHFSELSDVYTEQLGLRPNDVQCRECGWFYDEEQFANPNLEGRSNQLSLSQYREWYAAKIAENPKWEYYVEQAGDPEPHRCPVCGEYEFGDTLSYDICPICGWEDNGFEAAPSEKPGPSMMSFEERKDWFEKERTKNPSFRQGRAK